jgi:hypothetical protein
LDKEVRRLAAAVVERAIIDFCKADDEDICIVTSDILNGGLTFWLECLDLVVTPEEILAKAKKAKKEKEMARLTKGKKNGKIKAER